jgi:hypothetical protein
VTKDLGVAHPTVQKETMEKPIDKGAFALTACHNSTKIMVTL